MTFKRYVAREVFQVVVANLNWPGRLDKTIEASLW